MNLENLRVVFDTNIYISAVMFGGNSGKTYLMALTGKFTLFTFPEIIKEINNCLTCKFLWDPEKAQDYIEQIERVAHIINITDNVKGVCRDPKDDHILSLGIKANANYIVSGDIDLLTLEEFENIKIVNTSTFLKTITPS